MTDLRYGPLDAARLREILTGPLGVRPGDLLMVHASLDRLHAALAPLAILELLRDVVGPEGTLVFLSYSLRIGAAEILERPVAFDARRTPTDAGLLCELARRLPGARRSVHPTRSACAIGPRAEELVAGHDRSPAPYGPETPYGRLVRWGGRAVGLGVTVDALTLLHCTEDFLGDAFPVQRYLPGTREGCCIDSDGSRRLVATKVSDPAVVGRDMEGFTRTHIAPEVCRDLRIRGRWFFRCEAGPFVARMVELAEQGVTVFPVVGSEIKRKRGRGPDGRALSR